jgi:hypothetical protein
MKTALYCVVASKEKQSSASCARPALVWKPFVARPDKASLCPQ